MIKCKKRWKELDENTHFNLEDLVVHGPIWDSIWVRVVGNGHETMEYLYKIMNSEKRFIRFMVEAPLYRKE